MKKLFTFTLLLFSFSLFAQVPTYDDCSGLFQLGVAPNCPVDTIFNNLNATESDIGFDNFPPCFNGGSPARDVWISFVASDTIFDYVVELTACPDDVLGIDPIFQPQIAVYRGDCGVDELVILDCVSAEVGESNVSLNLQGLTPGLEYFLRINDWSVNATPNWGAFKLCVQEVTDCNLGECPDGINTACSGAIFDSGGPDGDYGPNENFLYTICPSDLHSCINFSLEYYNIEFGGFGGGGDQLNIYDGDSNTSPLLASADGSDFSTTGGVCLSVGASSGCVTLEFISDGTNEFEGFAATWECTQAECDNPPAAIVNTDITDQDIINNITTPQVQVTIDTINCPTGAIGTFNAAGTGLGLEKGLIITSGNAGGMIGPSSNFSSAIIGTPGDDDLTALSPGNPSQDACVVELDVFVATDELTFEYIFGSEEYPEFANSTFNDIFALLVSGPGITGDPVLNGQNNIATLPDGTPVQITSVNDGLNWEYYRDNLVTNNPGLNSANTIGYDGLTSDFLGVKKSLTASQSVTPCNTYHLKFAIADRGDSSFDSGVFIGELSGGAPSLTYQGNNNIDYLVEECTIVPDDVVINIGTVQDNATTFVVTIGGTAEQGIDYELVIPDTITIPAGESSVSFPINALPDGITEGTETIEITLSNNFGCGDIIYSTLVIELEDNLEVEIFAGADTVFVCQDGCATVTAQGAETYLWTPPSANFSDPTDQSTEVCPTESQFIFVRGDLGICTDRDTIWLEIVDPEIEIVADGETNFCQGDSVSLTANNNVGNSNLTWIPDVAITPNANAPMITVQPDNNTAYIARVELAGCSAQDTIQINVDEFDFPDLTVVDTFICQNFPVTLANPIGNTTTTYQWTSDPDDPMSIDCDTCANPTVLPQVLTTYTVVATSENAYCDETATVTIDVAPADVEIEGLDTIFLCVGDTLDLNAVTTTPGTGLIWTPDEFISSTTDDQVLVSPEETTNYFAQLTVGACVVTDSVLIVVDSLPDLSIIAIPDEESYCEGDEITFISQTYEPFDYPNIEFLWTPDGGFQTPDSNLNMVVLAQGGETIYVRETTNRACTSLDTIIIEAVPSSLAMIEPAFSTICPGESIDLLLTADNPLIPEDVTWSPEATLSCNNCLDPTATPDATTTYTAEIDFDGCPVSANATVEVSGPESIQPPNPPSICFGESIVLNGINDPNSTYTWNGGQLVDDPNPQPEVSPTETTTYNVVVDNGACTIEESVTITVIPDYTIALTQEDATLCFGESIDLGVTTTDSNGNAVNGNFSWLLDGGVVGNTGTITVTPPVGTNDYIVTFTDDAGCQTNSLQVTIEVGEEPLSPQPETNIVCIDDNTVLLNVNPDGDATYTWFVDDTTISTEAAPTDNPTETTTYVVQISNGICQIVENFTIEVIQNYDLQFEVDSVCANQLPAEVTLGGSTDPSTSGSYTWFLNGEVVGQEATLNTTIDSTQVFELEFTDDNNCSTQNVSVEATVNSVPVASFQVNLDGEAVDSVFEGQLITLVTTPGFENYLFTEDGTPLDGSTSSISIEAPQIDDDVNQDANETFIYGVLVQNEFGCDTLLLDTIVVKNNIIGFPNAFTPNGDEFNGTFNIVSTGRPVIVETLRIYNRWGNTVYELNDGTSDDGWNGGKDNNDEDPLPADVYFYYLEYRINQGDEIQTRKGDVTLIR